MENQKRLIERDKEYLTLRERECMLRVQLRELNTQQGQIGLSIINIQQEMQLLERKIEDVKRERESAYKSQYDARKKKTKSGKGKR